MKYFITETISLFKIRASGRFVIWPFCNSKLEVCQISVRKKYEGKFDIFYSRFE